jgi:hypothetical protein
MVVAARLFHEVALTGAQRSTPVGVLVGEDIGQVAAKDLALNAYSDLAVNAGI